MADNQQHYQQQQTANNGNNHTPLSFHHAHMTSDAFHASPFASLTTFPSAAAGSSGVEQPSPFHFTHTPHALTSSALDAGVVYRGMHTEPTMFAQPQLLHHSQQQHEPAWHEYAYGAAPQTSAPVPSKKLEVPTLSLVASALPPAAAAPVFGTVSLPQPSSVGLELPSVPSHVERFTSFYSSASPVAISKALRIAFQTLTDMRVEVTEEAAKAKVSETPAISRLPLGGCLPLSMACLQAIPATALNLSCSRPLFFSFL